MTDKELLEKAIYWFRVIAEDMERITSGNLPHNAATTKGRAIRAYEFLEKHKNDTPQEEPVSSIWHDASEPPIIDKTFLLVAPNGNSSLCLWGGKELHSVTIGGGHSVLCKGDIYSYIDDLLNLDNSCNFGKNLQEEPVSVRFVFKAIPRLLEMIEPTDRAKAYIAKLADTLEAEGYSTDAKIVMESLKIMNGEKVPMATMDEEPVSDDFTKALAECIHKAQCSVVDPLAHAEVWKEELVKLVKCEEPVSEELEEASKEWLSPQLDKSYVNYGEAKMMELTHFDGYAMLDAIDFGAKWQKAKDESTTEDLGEYINELSKQFPEVSFAKLSRIAVMVAKWKEEQMMEKAIDVEVKVDAGGYPYIPQMELYDYDKDVPLAKAGDGYKAILIKEE